MKKRQRWFVYILRCADGSYYTGIARDTAARVAAHNKGRGAAYTRSHRPVRLIYREIRFSKAAAMSRELAIKRLSRDQKAGLVLRGRQQDIPVAAGTRPSVAVGRHGPR